MSKVGKWESGKVKVKSYLLFLVITNFFCNFVPRTSRVATLAHQPA